VSEVPIPEVAEGECLIRVRASAVNRADILQRQGKYPPPKGATTIIGLECAGEVVDSKTLKPTGEKVMALLPGGGYA
jgi:NADPH:quinone reductase-like Zn-dependent oxidoreductase